MLGEEVRFLKKKPLLLSLATLNSFFRLHSYRSPPPTDSWAEDALCNTHDVSASSKTPPYFHCGSHQSHCRQFLHGRLFFFHSRQKRERPHRKPLLPFGCALLKFSGSIWFGVAASCNSLALSLFFDRGIAEIDFTMKSAAVRQALPVPQRHTDC